MFDMSCPQASVSSSHLTATGTVNYGADLTYSSNYRINGSITVNLPASCLTTQGITITCDQLNQVFAMDPTAPPGLHCVASGGGGCACTIVEMNTASAETGTYTTTAAGVLTETPAGGTPSTSDYCVRGTTLTESPRADSTVMGGVSGTIAYAKQ
jgi:hypothetical protein